MNEKEVFPKRQTRSTYEQVKTILERCNEPTPPTKIYYHLESSYTYFKKTLSDAVRLKLLKKTQNGYLITPKGVDYLCNWQRFLTFLKGEENVSP